MKIKFTRPKNLPALFSRATKDADEHGITWTGDMNQGHGSGRGFEGRYVVDADYITVHVLKKPVLITKSRIEKAVQQYLSQSA